MKEATKKRCLGRTLNNKQCRKRVKEGKLCFQHKTSSQTSSPSTTPPTSPTTTTSPASPSTPSFITSTSKHICTPEQVSPLARLQLKDYRGMVKIKEQSFELPIEQWNSISQEDIDVFVNAINATTVFGSYDDGNEDTVKKYIDRVIVEANNRYCNRPELLLKPEFHLGSFDPTDGYGRNEYVLYDNGRSVIVGLLEACSDGKFYTKKAQSIGQILVSASMNHQFGSDRVVYGIVSSMSKWQFYVLHPQTKDHFIDVSAVFHAGILAKPHYVNTVSLFNEAAKNKKRLGETTDYNSNNHRLYDFYSYDTFKVIIAFLKLIFESVSDDNSLSETAKGCEM